ncbi:hypothetical protein K458DRAFT_394980 [Lentithecium fluviatile CBS 122367]|uniref:Uncharacterized protein n=1 Tax=Lentithecium fluviatile CBS 122367 TaxID=1168545 RepID=A0A6G1IKM9_9PLEO|nr:hypothetical protein K458DRAFT_394980 [Lentithecium fluviatile CBS 122367]
MAGGPTASAANLTPLGRWRPLDPPVSALPVATDASPSELNLNSPSPPPPSEQNAEPAQCTFASPPSTTYTNIYGNNGQKEPAFAGGVLLEQSVDMYLHPSRRWPQSDITASNSSPPASPNAGDAQRTACGPRASNANLVPLGRMRWKPAEAATGISTQHRPAPSSPTSQLVHAEPGRQQPQPAHVERLSHSDRDYRKDDRNDRRESSDHEKRQPPWRTREERPRPHESRYGRLEVDRSWVSPHRLRPGISIVGATVPYRHRMTDTASGRVLTIVAQIIREKSVIGTDTMSDTEYIRTRAAMVDHDHHFTVDTYLLVTATTTPCIRARGPLRLTDVATPNRNAITGMLIMLISLRGTMTGLEGRRGAGIDRSASDIYLVDFDVRDIECVLSPYRHAKQKRSLVVQIGHFGES